MDDILKDLMKSYIDDLEDRGKFYVYTVKARFGEMDISRVELKVAGIDLMSDVDAVCLRGYKTCTDGSKETVINWVPKIMIGVPRLVNKYPTYLEVEMAIPKIVVEEPGGELGVYKEILSFVTNLYLKPGVKSESDESEADSYVCKDGKYGKDYDFKVDDADWKVLADINSIKLI